MSNSNSQNLDHKVQLPVGLDDFGEIINKGLGFIDKTLFIKEVLDDINTKVTLITRPRRFGKTFNLSMLHCFLAPLVCGASTKGLFDNLKIAACGERYMKHQGQYPVVLMTFKDIKASSFIQATEMLAKQIGYLYSEHRYLLESDKLYDDEKRLFEKILNQCATETDLAFSIKDLLKYLQRYHQGIKPWLLIDEYDTPIQAAYSNNYYKDMVGLMRGVLGSALKNNPHLDRAVVTGILRVAKESLFSGVNNLEVYSVMNNKYGEYFGFTETEVSDVLQQAGLSDHLIAAREWYNGYRMGDHVIYNPWSIANFIKRTGMEEAYWINTSDNQLIKDLLKESPLLFKQDFESLMGGEELEKVIDDNMVFSYLDNNPTAVWSLLLASGYLKSVSSQNTDQGVLCYLAIPNKEVRNLYRQIIEQWLSDGYGVEWYNRFLESLITGEVEEFQQHLQKVILQIASYHDLGKEPEAFYQGLMLGFTVSLYNQYEIKSNREAGRGRFDVMLIPKDLAKLGIVLELKVKEKNQTLEDSAKAALAQIEANDYAQEFSQRGIAKVLKIGIGFEKKEFALRFAR